MPDLAIEQVSLLEAEAIDLFAAAEQARETAMEGMQTALDRAWQCGRRLNRIKDLVGHGNWIFWFEQFQGRLFESARRELSLRTAQIWMRIDRENPNAETVHDLSLDSVRKYSLGYVPEKERSAQDGDSTVPQVLHHLTLVNIGLKLKRQVEAGHARIDPAEARRDLKPLFEWLCDLYGISFS